ncbi:hypothetical protein [Archangium lipolyticum]|uniref:hypothetical protein n=1 Tax=Archangium lipolyticum TaxID=2970465 RepID=UPI00214A4886|nr:hypothetical protein [Archangium lipolyticum]
MDRNLARANPRAYAILHTGADPEAEAAFLRTLAPADVALHMEALLAALVLPPHPVTGGQLEPTVEVRGAEALGLAASLYVEEPEGERVTGFNVVKAYWLEPAEMHGLLEALWLANASFAQRPSKTTVLFSGGGQGLSLDARLGLVETLYGGLAFKRVDLTFSRCSIGPDGRQGEGCASLSLHWLAPDGGEALALFSHVKGNAHRDEVVSWARALSRERGWPRWENCEYVEG